MHAFDTTPEVSRRQCEIYRAMTPEQRFEIAWDMSLMFRELTFAGLEERFPHLSRSGIVTKYLEISFPDLMRR
jgi:hypothetical protein